MSSLIKDLYRFFIDQVIIKVLIIVIISLIVKSELKSVKTEEIANKSQIKILQNRIKFK